MKNFLLTLFILLITQYYTHAQAPEWTWAVAAGESEIDIAEAIATDADGNVYVAGQFYSGTITFGDFTLTSTASTSLFLVKYNASGTVLWATSSEGTGSVNCYDIDLDAEGNIYVVGQFSSLSLIFGSATLAVTGAEDAFIVKYNNDGSVIWARSAGGSQYDRCMSVASDIDNNIFISGNYSSASITFDDIALTNTDNGLNGFLAKYDSEGNVLWAFDMGGDEADWPRDVATGINGDVYLSGETQSTSISLGSITLINEGGVDVFVAKFDTNGNVLWAKQGEANGSVALGLALDNSDNVYVTGSFSNETIVFGSTTLTNSSQLPYSEFFIVKYDSNGNEQWAKSAGGELQEEGRDIAIDNSGNVCVTGFHISETSTWDSTTLTNAGDEDIFVVQYAPDGSMNWIMSAGNNLTDYPEALAIGPNNEVYTAGFFISYSLVLGSTTLYQSGQWDAFVAKITPSVGTDENLNVNQITAYPNPFAANCTFQSNRTLHHGTLIIENAFGENVYEVQNLNGKIFSLSRNGLASGIYFLKLLEGSQVVATSKLIVND